jgi:hypothetical protein
MMEHFTGPRGERDAFGNGKNTQAHRINLVMSTKPQTLHQISSRCGLPNIGRIRQHMRYLTEHRFCFQDGEAWGLTEDSAANFFGESYSKNPSKSKNDANSNGSDNQKEQNLGSTPDNFRNQSGGAGFGDPETNKKVEKAAILFVTKWYLLHGWTVETVEAKKCGFDLRCIRANAEEHVEVKGIQGEGLSFPITSSEVDKAKKDSAFIISIVTSALSNQPLMHRFTGQAFLNSFDLKPLTFMAQIHRKKR